jgi:hypothetical protein
MKNITNEEKEELKNIQDEGYLHDYTIPLVKRLKFKKILANFVETKIHKENIENLKKGDTSLKISLLSRLNKIIRNIELIQLKFLEDKELSEKELNNILFELAHLSFPISHAANLATKIKVLNK